MATAHPATASSERPARVAVLDSSPVRRTAIASTALSHGWQVRACERPLGILDALDDGGVEVVLLNWADLPRRGEDAEDLLTSLEEVPVVALAADDEAVKAALRSGASLALQESCDLEVLLLSINALLRQRPVQAALHQRLVVDDLIVHVANHTVERQGRRQVLSPTEWQLFSFLLAHPERTFDREHLARGAWGDGFRRRCAEVEVYVCRVRRKIERHPRRPLLLETVRNSGYRLASMPIPLSAA